MVTPTLSSLKDASSSSLVSMRDRSCTSAISCTKRGIIPGWKPYYGIVSSLLSFFPLIPFKGKFPWGTDHPRQQYPAQSKEFFQDYLGSYPSCINGIPLPFCSGFHQIPPNEIYILKKVTNQKNKTTYLTRMRTFFVLGFRFLLWILRGNWVQEYVSVWQNLELDLNSDLCHEL